MELDDLDDLDQLLGIDMNDPVQRLACDLVQADADYLTALTDLRFKAGLSREQVAERMDTTVEAVGDLESMSSDPRLSTLRRYALAVGATVAHAVTHPTNHGPDASRDRLDTR